MHDSIRLNLPYAPALRDMPACGIDQLTHSLDDLVIPGEIFAERNATTGSLRACRLTGGGVLATAQLGHQEVRHDSAHLRDLSGDDAIVLIALDGKGVVSQQGRTLPFGKGDITFRRARMPSVARVDEPASLVMLRLPIARLLRDALPGHPAFLPGRADAGSGIVRTIHSFIESALPGFARMSAAAIPAAEESLIALLAAAYLEASTYRADATDTRHAAATRNPLRWSQLTAYIDATLRDPELNVESCAHALGVSTRYVHKLFESMGTQYGRYVLQQRLACARADLANPFWHAQSIERIAYRNGFNDPAHFSRRFRACFGMSPREFRQRAGS
ncbi:AraC family transcriptional regulator [Paraburkholderia acidicola]|uniref:AraC family transcriptional regulator n=1 Tax=Paraburkholderia acidicola TaxID=1912599 RepID=A0A2A4ES69_9BURK|nr:AraC family transcriptional regulator [Paraburkholderia acidicola]PCE23006.1 AraC family transcriptional regulator [Paraburkholderia acidicola]